MNPTIKPTTKPTLTWDYLSLNDTGVLESGASNIYISPSASHGPSNTTTTTVRIGTATGQVQLSLATASPPIPHLENHFPTTGHIMQNFTDTLIGVGPICNV